jgi:hypothetical protein
MKSVNPRKFSATETRNFEITTINFTLKKSSIYMENSYSGGGKHVAETKKQDNTEDAAAVQRQTRQSR